MRTRWALALVVTAVGCGRVGFDGSGDPTDASIPSDASTGDASSSDAPSHDAPSVDALVDPDATTSRCFLELVVDPAAHCGCTLETACTTCQTFTLPAGTWRFTYMAGAVRTSATYEWNSVGSEPCGGCATPYPCYAIVTDLGPMPRANAALPTFEEAEAANVGLSVDYLVAPGGEFRAFYLDRACTDNEGAIRYCITPAPSPCVLGSFGAPVRVLGASTSSDDWNPSLTGDERTIFFSSWSPHLGQNDIWTASRAAIGDPFGAPVPVDALSSAAADATPFIARDGLEIFFSSERDGTSDFAIHRATRSDASGAWSAPEAVPELDSAWFDFALSLTPDGRTAYFASSRPGIGAQDIYVTRRSERGARFTTPEIVPELSSTAEDAHPTISSDGLEMFFVSTRPGGVGGADIWRATRPDTTSPFGDPTNLGAPINTPNDELGPFLSPDGRRLYFNWNASTTGGLNSDVYVATRDCLP